MKNFITFILGMTLFMQQNFAQVSEKTKSMSLGTQNTLIVSIPNADSDLIEDVWKDYMKEYGKAKRNRKTKEYFSDDAKIASVGGGNTMDIYAWAEDGQLMAAFDMGNGFLSKESHADAYEGAEVFLEEFGNEVTREMIREELKGEEKNLKKVEKKLSGLVKDNEGYHKDIERAKERIAKAEANIEQNLIDQENTQKEIEGQMEVVEKVKEKLENVGK